MNVDEVMKLASAYARLWTTDGSVNARQDLSRAVSALVAERDRAIEENDALLENVATLVAERDALRVDAERYRALRATMGPTARRSTVMPTVGVPFEQGCNYSRPEALDAAIDAARSAK